MKKRYEVRDISKSLGKFRTEKEMENFFFKNGKRAFTDKEMDCMWICSKGKYALWSMSAEDYLGSRGYFVPILAKNRAEQD